jgi:hypothetical protein
MTAKQMETLVAEYESAAQRHGNELTAPAANAAAKELFAIYKEIRRYGDEGVKQLLPLLRHSNKSVQCWAATHLLEVSPKEAVLALENLASESDGLMRTTASMTLREWKAGRLQI